MDQQAFSKVVALAEAAQRSTEREAGEPERVRAKAWQEYEEAVLSIDEDLELVRFLAADLSTKLNPDTLEPVLRRLSVLFPSSIGIKLCLAHSLYFQGADDEAHDLLDSVKRTEPFDPDVLHTEIDFAFQDGPERLRELSESVLRIHPNDGFAKAVIESVEAGINSLSFDLPALYARAHDEVR